MEILNHSAFLDVMESNQALAIWFINDTSSIGTYRLKKHAIKDFWKWVSSWAISLTYPSDLGYDDDGFILPELKIDRHILRTDLSIGSGETLFRVPDMSATGFHKEKRISVADRVAECVKIINQTDEIYCIWCETNYEADALRKAIPEAIEIRGSDKNEKKTEAAIDFSEGKIRVLISKPKIFGFGMNFQECHNVIFCGMSYSFESYYQALRRFWRFGQKKKVNIHIIVSENEKNILDVVMLKQREFESLKNNMLIAMREFTELNKSNGRKYTMGYTGNMFKAEDFTMILGDAVEEIKQIEDEEIHFTIFSPPFSQLYIYSDSYRDMGNCKNDKEFFSHFNFLIPELYRTLKQGRLCAVHCKQLVNYKGTHGTAGLRDFRGDIIREFQKNNFIYHSEVCIWKSPVTEMYRTKAHGLLYKQLRKDSSYSRQGLAEYLLIFRKWGEDREPIDWKTRANFELKKWQDYASPVWMSIQQTNVLNVKYKNNSDEKHICPLQLDVIERAVEMWSNPGDLVFSPFAGIGSEGYMANKLKRKFIGIELKKEYYDQAIKHISSIKSNTQEMFDIDQYKTDENNIEPHTDAERIAMEKEGQINLLKE